MAGFGDPSGFRIAVGSNIWGRLLVDLENPASSVSSGFSRLLRSTALDVPIMAAVIKQIMSLLIQNLVAVEKQRDLQNQDFAWTYP